MNLRGEGVISLSKLSKNSNILPKNANVFPAIFLAKNEEPFQKRRDKGQIEEIEDVPNMSPRCH